MKTKNLSSTPTILLLLTEQLNAFLLLVCLASGSEEMTMATQGTRQSQNNTSSVGYLDEKAIVKQQHIALFAQLNCSDPQISLNTQEDDDGFTVLTVSGPGHASPLVTSLPCVVHLTSQPDYVISAVVLEHIPCEGVVFLLLSGNTASRRWDVCSVWHAPGPDFTTESNVLDVSIEMTDLTYPCDFVINFRAVARPRAAEVVLRYLSAAEGYCSLVLFLRIFAQMF